MGFTKLLPAEQPLREGARQKRRMDPRGGLKTNVKLSISHACHFERSRENFVIRGQGLTLSPHVPRTSPLSSAVFHPACALSAPSGHLPLEGKADDTREVCHQETFGHRRYLYFAALLIFMRRTIISHF